MAIKLGGGGGISIPIGGSVSLLDTENTVSKSGETFLKNGQLSNASTYPTAPVRNFFGAGTLSPQSFGGEISSFGTDTTPDGNYYGNSVSHNSISNSYTRATTSYNDTMYFLNWTGSALFCYRYENTHTATPVFVNKKRINDGTILPTGGSMYTGAAMMQAAQFGMTYQMSSSITSQRGNTPTVGVDRVGISMFTGGNLYLALLSGDLQTHIMTLVLSPKGAWRDPQFAKMFYLNAGSANDALTADKYFVVWMNTSNHLTFTRYAAPTAAQVSAGGNQTLTYENEWSYAYNGYAPYFHSNPEIWPYYDGLDTDPAKLGRIGVRGAASAVASGAQRIIYYDMDHSMSNGQVYSGHWTSRAYDTSIPTSVTAGYNSPHFHRTNQVPGIMRVGIAAPTSHRYDNISTTNFTLPAALDSSNYTGYAYASATSIYFGQSDTGKAYPVNPSTLAVGTPITLSGQAAPYRFTWYNNVLYNLSGTNIHSYNTTNGSFVATVAISDEFSGTNATGIATDGTYIYVIDKSNSRLYKYTISNMAATPTYVTLSDNPHTLSGTIDSIAIDNAKLYLCRDNKIRLYNLADGVYGAAFKTMASGDMDVHDSNIVVAYGTVQQVAATIQLDKVGHPSDGTGEITSAYTRVQ